MAGEAPERQENSFIRLVNDSVKRNKKNPITLVIGKITIKNVTGAEKYKGRQASGSEPYTDVVLNIGMNKTFNLSMKGPSAPSLAGGGLRGIEVISPGLGKKYFKRVYDHLIKTEKLSPGDKVPDIYGKIPANLTEKLIVGNAKMGGPIDYMYIGSMSVPGKYDANKNILTITQTELTRAEDYAKKHTLYFRLRARRIDQRFDPEAKDSDGTPKIYSKSEKGDSVGRLVVVSEKAVPSNAKVIRI